MAIKFEKIEAGMELCDVHRAPMGNTRMTQLGVWTVKIIEVNKKERTVLASWNGNKAEWWPEYRVTRLYSPNSPTVKRLEQPEDGEEER